MNHIYLLVISICAQFLFSANLKAECNIGLLYPLTGNFASAGQDCLDGHRVALDRHAEKKLPIQFQIEDSRGEGKEGLTQFKKLADLDHVQAVGIVRAAVGMPINPISRQSNIPIIGPVSHPDFTKQNANAYQIWPSPEEETLVLAKLIIADGVKSIYSLSSEDAWYLSFQEALIKNYTSLGGQIVANEELNGSFLDFRSLFSKIKKSQAETVFLGLSPSQLVSFIKQFREAGFKQKIYTTFWVKSEDVQKNLNPNLLDQIAFADIDASKPKFALMSKSLNQERLPSSMSYTCYLTSEALIQACENHLVTGQSFQEIFKKMKTIDALDDVVSINNQIAQLKVIPREFKK